jgi:hypothetical protein
MPSDRKTIRLRSPIRSGNAIVPNNAVVDATAEIAEELVGTGHAEYTDAIERYPNKPFLDVLNDFPVTGAEKFPKPEGVEPVFNKEAFGTELDRRLAGADAGVVPAWDHPAKVGDEASPAKVPAAAPAARPAAGPAPTAAPATAPAGAATAPKAPDAK